MRKTGRMIHQYRDSRREKENLRERDREKEDQKERAEKERQMDTGGAGMERQANK